MKVVVVVPTYNERENIQALIPALRNQLHLTPNQGHILVVDDHSPDNTSEAVRALMSEDPGLHLLSGEKQGLGVAYIRGMRHALDVLSADVVVEMDADFSHEPADLPRLLKALESPADFVIGSRYVTGGSIPSTWSLHRRLNSRFGNFAARYIAGLYGIRDCTAGFRAIRATVLKRLDFGALRVKGYAFQIALLHQAMVVGARIIEIPVHFADRKLGESKLGLRDIVEFLINVWWIRLWSARTFIKFCVVGATGVVVNLGAFSALVVAGINPLIASPFAVELSILWNFSFNNSWTFRYRSKSEHIGIRGLKFNIVSVCSLAVTFVTFVGLSRVFPAWPLMFDQLLAIFPAVAVNYLLNSYWTFRPRMEERNPSSVSSAQHIP